MLNIKEILEKLCAVKSPSGFEGEISRVIKEIAEGAGLSCETDALGNLFVRRPGVGKRVLLAAHMDTTGFLATFIDKDGFVRFDMLGGMLTSEIQNIPVEFLNGIRGTIAYELKSELKGRKTTSLFIDIGAKDEESARSLILPGDAAVFAGDLRELSGGRICAPYLDNRLGCAIALYTMLNLKNCDYDVVCAFTVQEEVGCRGAKTAGYLSEADFSIVLDVTDSCDTPGYDGFGDVKMGKGTAIKIMDRAAIANPEIVSALISCAEKESIPHQRDIITIGGTDAGSISLSRGGIPTGGISVPVRYMHTPCEVADMSDIESSAKLLISALESGAIICPANTAKDIFK